MIQPPRLDDVVKGVSVPFERLQEALEDAVQRGRITRRDAEDLAMRLLGPVVGRIGADGGLPIDGYEDLTAAEIVDRLDDLADGELRVVRAHEEHHANRVSILRVIDGRLG